jgi:mannitol/fructose-specific phosphotransferase system IIA component (Ntr-type)
LQQIFVVATLEKQTMFKEVKKLNNDFQLLFIVVEKDKEIKKLTSKLQQLTKLVVQEK